MKRITAIALITLLALTVSACTDNPPAGGDSKIPQGYVKENGSLMFDEPAENYAIYNYCPSIFEENGVRYAYYCSNMYNTNVKDYVAFRRGEKIDGEWYWSEKQFVLAPTESTWDSMHTCDPDVIKGEFKYNGETYNYLMTYLGCVTTNNQCNEVGLAVAKSPEGPFIKCDEINPIVSYTYDPSRPEVFQWGYGQSSLVSVDKKGKVLLYYTQGTTTENGIRVERWDLSDLNNPVKEYSQKMFLKGIRTWDNTTTATISNADFAYDPVGKRFFVIGDGFPFVTADEPSFVAAKSFVGFVKASTAENAVLGDIFNAYDGRSWNNVGFVSSAISGYERNHNACIVADEYGWLLNGNLEVAYTVAELNKPSNSLWTYRIHRYFYGKI